MTPIRCILGLRHWQALFALAGVTPRACGGTLASGQLPAGVSMQPCSYDGSVGTITARLTTPVTLDYTVTYTVVLR